MCVLQHCAGEGENTTVTDPILLQLNNCVADERERERENEREEYRGTRERDRERYRDTEQTDRDRETESMGAVVPE